MNAPKFKPGDTVYFLTTDTIRGCQINGLCISRWGTTYQSVNEPDLAKLNEEDLFASLSEAMQIFKYGQE